MACKLWKSAFRGLHKVWWFMILSYTFSDIALAIYWDSRNPLASSKLAKYRDNMNKWNTKICNRVADYNFQRVRVYKSTSRLNEKSTQRRLHWPISTINTSHFIKNLFSYFKIALCYEILNIFQKKYGNSSSLLAHLVQYFTTFILKHIFLS